MDGSAWSGRADEIRKKLAELVPGAVVEKVTGVDINGRPVTEPAIDADVLAKELGLEVVGTGTERYRFTWPGKGAAAREAGAPPLKVLAACPEEGAGRDGTPGGLDSENLYVEGDNLEGLKLLRETYRGKVKMIYIDPPYNTGSELVYHDNFTSSAAEYLSMLGREAPGETGTQEGRFHADWLNMMYPRLQLARDFLTEDGAIFISIDDNELVNLKKMCDEIFGAASYVATFPWRKRTAKSDVPFGVSQDYEWVVCYARSRQFMAWTEGKGRRYYETPDHPGRPWRIHDLTKQTSAAERPNSFFTIVNPKTGEEYPASRSRTWAITRETFDKYYQADRIVFPGDYDFLNIRKPVLRYWREDDEKKAGGAPDRAAVSTRLPEEVGMSQNGTKEITALFGSKVFSFPKPVALIAYLVKICTGEGDIVMDFFAGSSTTAHAVIRQNFQDMLCGKPGGRRFIMIQQPEICSEKSEARRAGFATISDIGKERIRRAGKAEYEDFCAEAAQAKGKPGGYPQADIGFRVLKCSGAGTEDKEADKQC